ncbi:MAG: hypothetical protein V1659_04535 [Candidatus Woesearchaeota archaeon]
MEKEIGKITHYFDHISVAVLLLTKGGLKTSDKIRIKGSHTDFTQQVLSMQIDKKDIHEAKKGDDIGIKVANEVKEGDIVYKVTEK